jgi:very-short-patch-repair endonuclease
MFLSLIVTKDNQKAITGNMFKQRFNVAASRARDRMYLVRSIEIDQLSPGDELRRNLIEHFTVPYTQDQDRVNNLRDLCESNFELEVYDFLTERGYMVTPQVSVGAYRIDMVVDGHQDTRLAIECDGDRYHDASRWSDDLNRQRILERMGWQFWRCFASQWVMNKDFEKNDLVESLKKLE